MRGKILCAGRLDFRNTKTSFTINRQEKRKMHKIKFSSDKTLGRLFYYPMLL